MSQLHDFLNQSVYKDSPIETFQIPYVFGCYSNGDQIYAPNVGGSPTDSDYAGKCLGAIVEQNNFMLKWLDNFGGLPLAVLLEGIGGGKPSAVIQTLLSAKEANEGESRGLAEGTALVDIPSDDATSLYTNVFFKPAQTGLMTVLSKIPAVGTAVNSVLSLLDGLDLGEQVLQGIAQGLSEGIVQIILKELFGGEVPTGNDETCQKVADALQALCDALASYSLDMDILKSGSVKIRAFGVKTENDSL